MCNKLQIEVDLHPDDRFIAIGGAISGTVHGFVFDLNTIQGSRKVLEASSQDRLFPHDIPDPRCDQTVHALLRCNEAGMRLFTTADIRPNWFPGHPSPTSDTFETLRAESDHPRDSGSDKDLVPHLDQKSDQIVLDAFQRMRWVPADARDEHVVYLFWERL